MAFASSRALLMPLWLLKSAPQSVWVQHFGVMLLRYPLNCRDLGRKIGHLQECRAWLQIKLDHKMIMIQNVWLGPEEHGAIFAHERVAAEIVILLFSKFQVYGWFLTSKPSWRRYRHACWHHITELEREYSLMCVFAVAFERLHNPLIRYEMF